MRASRILGGLAVLALVASTTACGCLDDVGGRIQGPGRQTADHQVGIEIPRAAVRKDGEKLVKVDVLFLLDDSEAVTAGRILGDQDARLQSDVAQLIFANATQQLQTRLTTVDGVGQGEVPPVDFDLAFGMARFEDYANFARAGGTRPDVDGESRPYILNQPILREDHPDFNLRFNAGLSRETPGLGGTAPDDPSSGLEALYQAATGTGFNGNPGDPGDTGTGDSGVAGAISTQLTPGTSGDVPAPTYVDNGTDPDGEPVYTVGDTIASGNLGGAGWRPDSIRMIVVYTDTCTVTTLRELGVADPIDNQPFVPEAGSTAPNPRSAETITSTQAFACIEGIPAQQSVERFGQAVDQAPAMPVAPTGAAGLQATIDALNEANIDVLGIAPRKTIEPGPNKPNVPFTPPLPGEWPAVENPNEPAFARQAFTWLSAVAILTGARDPNLINESDPTGTWKEGLPCVYSLLGLSPQPGTVLPDLVADLSDRIGMWVPHRTIVLPGVGTDAGSTYYWVTFDYTMNNQDLDVDPDGGSALLPISDPDGIYVRVDGNRQLIRVPNYYAADPSAVTTPIRVAWSINVRVADEENLAAILQVSPFNLTPALAPAGDVPVAANPDGDYDGIGLPGVVPSSGSVTLVFPEVTEANPTPLVTSTLTEVTSGAALFQDLNRPVGGTGIADMPGPFADAQTPQPAP